MPGVSRRVVPPEGGLQHEMSHIGVFGCISIERRQKRRGRRGHFRDSVRISPEGLSETLKDNMPLRVKEDIKDRT